MASYDLTIRLRPSRRWPIYLLFLLPRRFRAPLVPRLCRGGIQYRTSGDFWSTLR